MNYIIIEKHHSNYPKPIIIKKGTKLKIGDKYNGPENWENWRFCYTLDDKTKGWIPEQLLII